MVVNLFIVRIMAKGIKRAGKAIVFRLLGSLMACERSKARSDVGYQKPEQFSTLKNLQTFGQFLLPTSYFRLPTRTFAA